LIEGEEGGSMEAPGELRQSLLTGRWAVLASARLGRPSDGEGPGKVGVCPFCPGNEAELLGVLWETPGPAPAGWATRAVANRFPAFTDPSGSAGNNGPGHSNGDRGFDTELPFCSEPVVGASAALPALGYQEVIVESPHHDRDLSDMDHDELRGVVDTYHERYRALSEAAPARAIFLFRNHGREAGASLRHPHAQVVATRTVPPRTRIRQLRMAAYHSDSGRCLVCALPRLEGDWDTRVVARNSRFTAVVPWAPEARFETWIFPRVHQSDFGAADDADREALTGVLREVLCLLREPGGDPPYNLMVHSSGRPGVPSPALHWCIQIRPRAAQPAGFELASGVSMSAASPARDAALLRGGRTS
jgi:UDPglucose--hexose-1-phosphate uridylyltransferase